DYYCGARDSSLSVHIF
nr:immunoglobulin light chain junction region [Macaca mulatta]MOW31758.1 immunoglobulin light chain junction region [Macaca mulatta]MOW32011.1 immunoglobulin light chain junction region [Macaca mulatta]